MGRHENVPGLTWEEHLARQGWRLDGDRAVRPTPRTLPAPTMPQAAPGVRLILPLPPTVNHLYTVANGRKILSSAGRDYRRAVASAVLQQTASRPPLTGSLAITVRMHAPADGHRRDLDNYLKSTLDALVRSGVLADDSLIDHIEKTRGRPAEPGYLAILIAPWEGDLHG